MRMGLEMIVLPVTDIDRAKAFYEKLGFTCDVDHDTAAMRIVQFTPPESGCSIVFGRGLGPTTDAPVRGLHLVVSDMAGALNELQERGIDVSEPFHFGAEGRASGIDPAHTDYASFAEFSDPDGNGWVLQEVPSRAEG